MVSKLKNTTLVLYFMDSYGEPQFLFKSILASLAGVSIPALAFGFLI